MQTQIQCILIVLLPPHAAVHGSEVLHNTMPARKPNPCSLGWSRGTACALVVVVFRVVQQDRKL
jgi:hypothetical protein